MNLLKKIRNAYYITRLKKEKLSQNIRYASYENDAASYVNHNNYTSSTGYLIWVDTLSFKVNIFTGSNNNWRIKKSYLCSIGKQSTPTPKGTFFVGIKGYSFGQNHGYVCYYYTQIKNNYLFHSILYNLDGTIRDGRLGMKISDGCIRLLKENAKCLHDNVPSGTTIKIT